MTRFPRRWAMASVAALALIATPALAQTDSGEDMQDQGAASTTDGAAGEVEENAAPLPKGTPTPTDPAATETPDMPAAAGGTASDATRSGGPASSAPETEESGGASDGASGGTSEDPEEPSSSQMPEAGNAGASPANPRNAVGDKFELPQVSNSNQIELIEGLCGIQMKSMSEEACNCLADQALETLSDPQRDYLIASVVAPPVADRMLNDGRVGQPDQETIFTFLNSTSDACATGTFKPAAEGAPSGDASPSSPADTMRPDAGGSGNAMPSDNGSSSGQGGATSSQ